MFLPEMSHATPEVLQLVAVASILLENSNIYTNRYELEEFGALNKKKAAILSELGYD